MTKFLRIKIFLLALLLWVTSWADGVCVIAHEAGYYTSLARHASRWLKEQGIDAPCCDASNLAKSLEGKSLAYLVGFDAPSKSEMAHLETFCSKGGKLVVFYSSSPALARLMGVKILGYTKAAYPGQWSRMDFKAKYPSGLPGAIRQTSTVLQRAEPLKGKGHVMATWSDRIGIPSGDVAWIATGNGFWMTHVLLADGDEDLKARLLAAIAGAVSPKIWNAKSADAKARAKRAELVDFAQRFKGAKGEIRAVWDHSGCGLYPGDWAKTFRVLKDGGVTDLYVNVAGAAFAHYPSNVLPRSKIFEQEGDQLKACLKAAAGSGVRVHAWILCFNATRATSERLAKFASWGWRLKTRDGALSEYLDPANAEVRTHILKAIDEIQKRYAVDGIHLDFLRWYEKAQKPAGAVSIISSFVAEARKHVKGKVFSVAVLGKYPMCVASVAQDWVAWLDAGSVDYVVPMDYTEDDAKFESFLAQHASAKKHLSKIVVGIGVTANESRLDARKTISQISLARKYHLAGTALFDLDATLEKNILPYLSMGIWGKSR